MKRKIAYLPIVVIGYLLMALSSGCHSHKEKNDSSLKNDTESASYEYNYVELPEVQEARQNEESEELPITDSWEEPPIPKFLTNYMDSTLWSANTICVVNGKAYYRAYDEYGRTSAIYTLSELLCEDPTLTYDSLDTKSKTKFHVRTAHKSLFVDFANKEDVRKLKAMIPHYSSVQHFRKDYFSKTGNVVLYHFEVDYPKSSITYCDVIRQWLIRKVNESLTNDEDVPEANAIYIGYNKRNLNQWTFKGDINDIKAVGRFASNRYFEIKKQEYGEDRHDYPCALFFDLSLRLISTNGKYYSYQKQTHEYNGGAHGFYTENIVSLDPKTNEEIDWKYLFVSGCEDEIYSLYYKVVRKDPHYIESRIGMYSPETEEQFKDRLCVQEGKNILPKPGLTDIGVVFSYQPYEIGSFADGTSHFTIPYKDLKPFMTAKAKKLLNL